ncbi:uncharacterized protein LOC116339503 [Contarinia nasturtii]|uniref:uncharacterized protein LOC116339503 n=1 Tax=Contarinia nasturtii TaxID=265458 RepID=UPI0012D48F31|nr:uncharacterized protein LOC116339503 [Contarinia nasturtii]
MTDENIDFGLRRLTFIEACAYYVLIKNIRVDQLTMTQELADLITARYRSMNLSWAIDRIRSYNKLLEDGMQEKMENFDGEKLCKSVVLRYNFQSLVAKEVEYKRQLLASPQNLESNTAPNGCKPNGNGVWCTASLQQALPSATPHDFLIGFTVHIKPDVHLDETIPICARDQHLLYNIFGDKWKSPVIINAYAAVKGQTGFMNNWLSSNAGNKSVENTKSL